MKISKYLGSLLTNAVGPESEILGSLKNLKPEKKYASEQNLIGVFTS